MRQVACLSLDGGGLLALSELYILRETMLRLQWVLNLPTLPLPCDHFDIIGGSGSGGLIAILLGRLRLSVDQAIESFLDIYRALYSQPISKTSRSNYLKNSVQSLVQLFTPDGNANEVMMENNPKCKMFVCAMPSASMTGFRPECFRNYRSRKHGSYNCKIWEAARATTSHPSSFNSIRIGPLWSAEDYVGAGFGFTNPIDVVIDETKSWFPLSSHVHIVLSLGAGHPGIFGPPRAGDGWASVLENIAVDCERTANRIAQCNGDGYFRLNVSQGLQGIMFQDWTDPGRIVSHTKQYIASGSVDQHIDELVHALVQRCHQPIASCLSLVDPSITRLISCLPQVNVWDIELDHEVVVRRNYRFCIGRVLAERRVLVQIFHSRNALQQRDKTLQLYMALKHPNLLAVFRQSNDLSSDPSILFSNEIIAPAEQQLSRALELSDTTSLANQGFSLVASLAAGLSFLEMKAQQIRSTLTFEDFVIFFKTDGQFLLAFTPTIEEDNVLSAASNLDTHLLQRLCCKSLIDATLIAHASTAISSQNLLLEATRNEQLEELLRPAKVKPSPHYSRAKAAPSPSNVSIEHRIFTWQNSDARGFSLAFIADQYRIFQPKPPRRFFHTMALPISKHPRLLSQPHDEIRLSLLPDWSAIYSHISPVGLRSTLTMPNAPRLLHRLPFQEDESSDEDCSENRHASVLLTNETWLPLGQSIVEEIYNPSNEAPHILPPNRDIDRSYSPLSPAPYLSVNSPNNHLYIQTIAHGRSGEASSPDFTEGQRSVRTNPMPLVPSTMQMFFNGSPIQRPLPTPPHVEDSNSPNMVMKHLSSGGSESPAQPQPRTQEVMSRMFLEKFRALDANYELTVQLLEELEGDDEPQTRLAFHSNNWGEGGGGDGGGDGGHSALPHPRTRYQSMPLVPSLMQMFSSGSPTQRLLPTPPHAEGSNSPNMVGRHLPSGGSETPAQPQPRTQEVMSRMFLAKFKALDANYDLTGQWLNEVEPSGKAQAEAVSHSNASVSSMFDGKGSEQGSTARSDIGNRGWRRNRQHLPVKRRPLRVSSTQPHDTWPELSSEDNDSSDESSEVYDSFYEADVESGALPFNVEARYRAG